MRVGVIDLGSNSVLLLVGEMDETSGGPQILYEEMRTTRLGEGVRESGEMSNESMDRGVEILHHFKSKVDDYSVENISVYGTSVLRRAENSKDFVDRVRKELKMDVKVISKEEEGELSFLSAVMSVGMERAVVMDVGAMSVQVSWGCRGKVERTYSFPLGCLLLTERFGLDSEMSEGELAGVIDYIDGELSPLADEDLSGYPVITVGGSAVAVSALRNHLEKYDRDMIHRTKIKRDYIERSAVNLFKLCGEERARLLPFEPERGVILPAGLLTISRLLHKLDCNETTVCWWGLTYGMLVESLKDR